MHDTSFGKIVKFTPFLLFLMVWTVVFFLYSKEYYNIFHVSQSTFFLIYIAIISYAIAYLCFVSFDRNFISGRILKKQLIFSKKKLLKTILFLSFSSLLGIYIKAGAIANYFNGFEIYFSNPIIIRNAVTHLAEHPQLDNLQYKIGSYLINIGIISSFYAGIYFIKEKNSKYIILLPIATAVLSSLVTFSRFLFVSGILFLFLSVLFTSMFASDQEKKYVKKKLLYLTLFTFLLVFAMVSMIFAMRTFYSDKISELLYESLYFYITGGLVALDNFLNEPHKLSYGASSFRSLVNWLDIIGLWPSDQLFSTNNPFTQVAPNYIMNTYTFVKSLYQDFGLYGLMLIMTGWAYLSKFCIQLMLSKFSIYTLYFSVIVTFSLVMSFFSFYFQGLSLVIFWLIAIFISEQTFAKNAIRFSNDIDNS